MRIALVGDVHGCVYHCLAALLRLHRERPLDAVIQVGDLGAWPDRARMFDADPVSVWFTEDYPAQLDWFDLIDPQSVHGPDIVRARAALGRPIFFIRGNHDDAPWLKCLEPGQEGASADPCDVFRFLADATVIRLGDVTVAFLGGIECDPSWPRKLREEIGMHAFDPEAVRRLEALEPGSVDLLITHDGPYGVTTNWRGMLQGAPTLTRLVAHLRPRWHVAGHYHHKIGPEPRGAGVYLGLAAVVKPLSSKWGDGGFDPTGRVQPESVAVLDTGDGSFAFPGAQALRSLDRTLDFAQFMAGHDGAS